MQRSPSAQHMKKEYDLSKAKRGSVLTSKGKTRITIYLDDEILQAYRATADEQGRGYQTLINDALRRSVANESRPVDAKTLRRIIREELKKAG